MDVLATWMTEHSETDETLAAKLGVSRVQVSRLRRKICWPSTKTALDLEKLTDIPAAAFLLDGKQAHTTQAA